MCDTEQTLASEQIDTGAHMCVWRHLAGKHVQAIASFHLRRLMFARDSKFDIFASLIFEMFIFIKKNHFAPELNIRVSREMIGLIRN